MSDSEEIQKVDPENTTAPVEEEQPPFPAEEGVSYWTKTKNTPSSKPGAKLYRWTLRDAKTHKLLPTKQSTALVPSTGNATTKAEKKAFEQLRIEDIRNFMMQPADEPLPENATRLDKMLHSLYEIITDCGNVKGRVAAVAAVRELNNRLMGLAPTSIEDRKAAAQSNIKVVMIPVPDNMMNPQIVREEDVAAKRPKKPAFIDAEVVSTNPPKE